MYEVELEFPEGWRALIKNPFHGEGMDILWIYTTSIHYNSVDFVIAVTKITVKQ